MYYFYRSPILVPVDYSEASLRSLRIAMVMCDEPKDVTVLYVAPRMDLMVTVHKYGEQLTEDEVREADLKRMKAWIAENGIDSEVKTQVVVGDAGYEIAKYQKENDFPLVVMPSHGRHGLKRILLGSVTERVVRHCDCQVLVLRHNTADTDGRIPERWLPRKRVVVPIDFSESSPAAVWTAIETVESRPDVDVIHVVPVLDHIYSPYNRMRKDIVTDQVRRESRQQYLERWLAERDLDVIRAHAVSGDPGTTIVRYAKENNADLIVIPSHGFHGVNRMVLGSVAERVLRHAECPVLVTRRTDAE